MLGRYRRIGFSIGSSKALSNGMMGDSGLIHDKIACKIHSHKTNVSVHFMVMKRPTSGRVANDVWIYTLDGVSEKTRKTCNIEQSHASSRLVQSILLLVGIILRTGWTSQSVAL